MKPKHTYCFYMSNGEHIMTDADTLEVLEDSVPASEGRSGSAIYADIQEQPYGMGSDQMIIMGEERRNGDAFRSMENVL